MLFPERKNRFHCKTRDNYSVQFHLLPLRELYYEGNGFVRCEPMSSVQDVEVLTLKELAARFVLQEDRKKCSLVHTRLPHYPTLTALLDDCSCCAFCRKPFLGTWLECVHFINLKKFWVSSDHAAKTARDIR
ncbi:Leucine-rich repeat-containing protein 69 [Liparis tanakae]|uniref:Leucine-rich repeat-containing protein 69 n=1 Tax=Liparis tanakae TaxID=230148 RepID=A0A4Z2J7N3_9TELE|nr:Leucine-rich repeat-containing protein 69 [Liparis tanakae]